MRSRCRAEDDLLSPALHSRIEEVICELQQAPLDAVDEAIKKAQTDFAALPLPKRGKLYTFLDLVAVVGAVAFGLRGLFFQPFQIPTGSMQPTLFGIHYQQSEGNVNGGFGKVPGILHNLIYGTTRVYETHRGSEGFFQHIIESYAGRIFEYSELIIGNNRYRLPGNPRQVADYTGVLDRESFSPDEVICDGYMTVGDHLFVERVSMYISEPERGDIIVFNTEGLMVSGQKLTDIGGYYYIKRLAALPGDTVKIVDNQLYVRPAGESEFQRIQDLDPRFAKVYSMQGGYQGHLGNMGEYGFASGEEYTIAPDHYLMLGDNSNFSMDSRYFGPVPRKNLVGRAWFVFYPFSRRTGWVDRHDALPMPTGEAGESTFRPMFLQ